MAKLRGWTLVGATAAVLVAMALAIVLAPGPGIDALREFIRATPRFSLILFGLAFTASSLYRLAPNAWTRWQLQNRRYLGLSFALAHFTHGGAIGLLAAVDTALFLKLTNAVVWIGGGLGYLLVGAMAATSFDRTAAWLGPRRWRILHAVGGYYILFIFVTSYLGKTTADAFYWPLLAFTMAIVALRIAARFAKRPAAAPA